MKRIVLEAPPTEEEAKDIYLRIFAYGGAGNGKTTFLGNMDQEMLNRYGTRLLVIDAAGNPISLVERFDPLPIVVGLDRVDELNAIFTYLQTGQPAGHPVRKALGLEDGVIFGGVAIDTITEVQQMIINEAMGTGSAPATFKAPQIQDWQTITGRTVHIAALYYKLPMHVIFTAQERKEFDTLTETTRFVPYLAGQGGEAVPAYAELFVRFVRRMWEPAPVPGKPKERARLATLMYVDPIGDFEAKDQLTKGRLSSVVVDPTGVIIFDALEEVKKAKQKQ